MEIDKIFKSLSDRTRLRIMYVLLKARTELCICEIMDSIEIRQYNVSKHIRELKIAGLVKERRDGKFVFYSLSKEKDAFKKNIMNAVLSIPEDTYKDDMKRLEKRLALRINGRVVSTCRKEY